MYLSWFGTPCISVYSYRGSTSTGSSGGSVQGMAGTENVVGKL